MPAFNSNSVLDFEPSISSTESEKFGCLWGIASNTTMVGLVLYSSDFSSLSDGAKQFITKLHSFKTLEPNWDSYGAVPPSDENIYKAISIVKRADKNLLPLYFVAPGPNGEIVVEFKRNNREAAIYVNDDGSTELILNEGNNYLLEGTLEENYKDLLSFING